MQVSPFPLHADSLSSKHGDYDSEYSGQSYEAKDGDPIPTAERLTGVPSKISSASDSDSVIGAVQSPTARSDISGCTSLDSLYFTPSYDGNATFSPVIDPLELPQAQSGPPSPFDFPGRLVGFSSDAAESSHTMLPSGAPDPPFLDINARPASTHMPLLFQPHSPRAATSPVPQLALRQMPSELHGTPSLLCDSVRRDPKSVDGTTVLLSQVQSLGDEAISMYRKLSPHEVE